MFSTELFHYLPSSNYFLIMKYCLMGAAVVELDIHSHPLLMPDLHLL